MAWRTANVEEQRAQFVIAISTRDKKEKSFHSVCQEFQISRTTGYHWWRRYEAEGIVGMRERSRRPQNSPRKTAPEVEKQVVELRQKRPDWGARKLKELLRQQGVGLPAGTIHRILLRHDLVREADRQRPAGKRFAREQPNQMWQMDFKGPKGWNQRVGPLSVLDDHSRYAIALRGGVSQRGEAVQEALEQAFEQCGVPEQMLMDHGCPWWNEQGQRGWTRLGVWLMKQDIQLLFSGYNHPQTQGKVERFHRSLTQALLRRGTPWEEQRQAWLDEFRQEYNHLRPHAALGMKTPGQVWQKSERAYQPQPGEWKYPEGYGVMEVEDCGQVVIERRRYWLSGALGGEAVGWIEAGGRILVYYRKTLVRELDPRDQKSTAVDF